MLLTPLMTSLATMTRPIIIQTESISIARCSIRYLQSGCWIRLQKEGVRFVRKMSRPRKEKAEAGSSELHRRHHKKRSDSRFQARPTGTCRRTCGLSHFVLMNCSDAEFIQYRSPVGWGPSSNTWPRWASHRAHTTSSRTIIKLLSVSVFTFSFAIG